MYITKGYKVAKICLIFEGLQNYKHEKDNYKWHICRKRRLSAEKWSNLCKNWLQIGWLIYGVTQNCVCSSPCNPQVCHRGRDLMKTPLWKNDLTPQWNRGLRRCVTNLIKRHSPEVVAHNLSQEKISNIEWKSYLLLCCMILLRPFTPFLCKY